MKGVVFDIKKFAMHDGPGIRTTVFLKGCPLRCWWCHNPESIRKIPEIISVINNTSNGKICEEELIGKEYTPGELLKEIKKDEIFYDQSGGGVTFSGGEPLVQIKFLQKVLKHCKEENIHTTVDTSGYAPQKYFDRIFDITDLFLFDLKLMDSELHKKYTEVSNEKILNNLKMLTERGDKVIIRIPLIPGITDTEENLSKISEFISKLKNIKRIDLLPYNKLVESKNERFNNPIKLSKLKSQSKEKLDELKTFFDQLNIEINIKG